MNDREMGRELGRAMRDAGKVAERQVRVFDALLPLAAPQMDDKAALSIQDAWPSWDVGISYLAGQVVRHQGVAYRIIQDHTGQAHQPPGSEGMLAVYRPIVVEAAGTAEDPIPFVYGMDVEDGKYYSYEGALYLAKADMPACVWAPGTAGLWQWEKVG